MTSSADISLRSDHYSVLGVPSHADQRRIRGAYLSMLKKCHPDAALGCDPAQARAAIEAYFILGDARRKLAYDLGRARQTVARVQISTSPRMQTRGRTWPSGWLLFLMLVAAMAIVPVVYRPSELLAVPPIAKSLPAAHPTRSGQIIPTNVDYNQIENVVAEVVSSAANPASQEIKAVSRVCFDSFAETQSVTLLDRCVAFDIAVAISTGAGDLHYFEPSARIARHSRAIRTVSSDILHNQLRLSDIERATLSALTRQDAVRRFNRPVPAYPVPAY